VKRAQIVLDEQRARLGRAEEAVGRAREQAAAEAAEAPPKPAKPKKPSKKRQRMSEDAFDEMPAFEARPGARSQPRRRTLSASARAGARCSRHPERERERWRVLQQVL